uniref:Uncharacterized protein n=1 Tax=Anguilla anguilla TaxID=7936 RepID=A0A0E9P716_ANGAN
MTHATSEECIEMRITAIVKTKCNYNIG